MIMKLARLLTFLWIFSCISLAHATIHVITFAGISYTPNDISVSVGDTIEWQGDFSTHPLKSAPAPLAFPVGAAPFENSQGTTFRYVVTVPGDHGYFCQVHAGNGMVGKFTAIASDVNEVDNKMAALNAYPNPTSQQLTLSYTLTKGSNVHITLFDMNGRTLSETIAAGVSGPNTTYMSVSSLPVGSYYYSIQTSDAVLSRKFTISR
jgi:plastocyanin